MARLWVTSQKVIQLKPSAERRAEALKLIAQRDSEWRGYGLNEALVSLCHNLIEQHVQLIGIGMSAAVDEVTHRNRISGFCRQ